MKKKMMVLLLAASIGFAGCGSDTKSSTATYKGNDYESANTAGAAYDAEYATENAAEMIREKTLRSLGEEIPHGIAVVIDKMKERPDGKITDIEATIICERDSHKGIVIGKQGRMLKKIGSEARVDIEQMLETKVNLKIWVKVRKDWRESDILVKNYGYDRSDLKQ